MRSLPPVCEIAPVDAERADRILDLAKRIPEGMVATYGDLSPGAPRLAGTVLAASSDPGVPWHRVVRADGSLAKGVRQRKLLEREAVPFLRSRVDMEAARVPPGELEHIEPAR